MDHPRDADPQQATPGPDPETPAERAADPATPERPTGEQQADENRANDPPA
jgi:hypothetical protein